MIEEQETVAQTTEKTTENGTDGKNKAGTRTEEVSGDGAKKLRKTEMPAPVELSQEMERIVTWARETKDLNVEGGRGTGKGKTGPVEDQSVHAYLASSGFWDREMICTVQAGNLARGDPIDEGIPHSALTHSALTEAEKEDKARRSIYDGVPYAVLTEAEREDRAWRALIQGKRMRTSGGAVGGSNRRRIPEAEAGAVRRHQPRRAKKKDRGKPWSQFLTRGK